MKGNIYTFTTTEQIWKGVVGLSHHRNDIIKKMAKTEYIETGAVQKVEVCLDHDGKIEHIKMKWKPNIFESTGVVQTSGVGLDHKN